jgi:transposase
MKIHSNAALTVKQRERLHQLYATGKYSKTDLAHRFGATRKTIDKWLARTDANDRSSAPKEAHRSISEAYRAAVVAYRNDHRHHGAKRIVAELRNDFGVHGSVSTVYRILCAENLIHAASEEVAEPTYQSKPLKTGTFRTQMDVQFLPALEGNSGFEYKISIIHRATRIKYSEIHDNYESKTIAGVYERGIGTLAAFF